MQPRPLRRSLRPQLNYVHPIVLESHKLHTDAGCGPPHRLGTTPSRGSAPSLPGTPEPDDFDQESGTALVVDIPGPGAAPVVERICVSRYHWNKVNVHLHSPDALQQMKAAVAPLSAQLSTAVIDLSLAGAISLSDRNSVELELANLEAGCQVLRGHYAELLEEPTEADLDDLGRHGFIAGVVSRLRALETNQQGSDPLYARMALRRLYVEHVIGGHQ